MSNHSEFIILVGYGHPYGGEGMIINDTLFLHMKKGGWIIEEIRHMESSYIDSAIVIPDDLWADKDTYAWENFSRDFRKAYGEQPDRIAALGYDAAQILCQGLSKGAVTPEQLRDYLSAVNGFAGPSGNVSFDATGTNTETMLVRFDRNTPKRIR